MQRILLVNPPIHDFSAFDFWLKPFGLLRVAGELRGQAELTLFDYLDRLDPRHGAHANADRTHDFASSDEFGRGHFRSQPIATPQALDKFGRRYKRYGAPRSTFQSYLQSAGPFDFVLVQTVMTYWYPGVREVIEDVRRFAPGARIVLGGVYASICPAHARGLGADLVVEGLDLAPLWRFLGVEPESASASVSATAQPPLWEAYDRLKVGVLKLADGCPFRCTYCSVPQVYPDFEGRPLDRALDELELLCKLGAEDIAFYDDALLHKADRILLPFLRAASDRGLRARFHTPNALNARFITKEIAAAMVVGGFETFYLGFESSSYEWQRRTGGKVYSRELVSAVENLVSAGADRRHITAYLIVGHPSGDLQDVEASMRFASDLGLRIMLSEFSPIPGTPDGERCREWVDLDEPLWHSKTIFPLVHIGAEEVNRLKRLAKSLNAAYLESDATSGLGDTKLVRPMP